MRLEHWFYKLPLRLKSIFHWNAVEQELDEELQFHLDHKIEEGIARGLSPEAARREAMRAMGGLEQKKEESRDTRGIHWLTDFVDDVRFASRSLRRTPGLTALVIVTLALGVGMTTTPFSMVDALVFRPYPVPDPSNIVTLVSTSHDNAFETFSYREYLDLRDHTQSYDGVLASTGMQAAGFSADQTATPKIKGAMLVSANYFRVLGVEPEIGRGFRDDEDQVPGRDAVMVLGPDFFKREFASDPRTIGRTARVNGKEFTIVGVVPESFTGLRIFGGPDFYVPLAMAPDFSFDPQKNFFEDRGERGLYVRGRLKSGATLQTARNEIDVVAKAFERDYPDKNRDRGASVHTQFEMRTQGDDMNWKMGVIFSVLAVAVLLVACTNVAGLLLSRASGRSREIAVRLSMGAGRFRLIRLLLTESLILCLLGGALGVVVGYLGLDFIKAFRIPTELPTVIPFRMDLRILFASFVVSVLCAVFCGLAPALQSSKADLVNALKSTDLDLSRGARKLWGRNVLVVAQVSMSLMLLTAALLMARGFKSSVEGPSDFSRENLLMARFDPRLVQYDAEQTHQFYRQLAERVRQTPGVKSATLTQTPPLGLDDFARLAFVPESYELPRDRKNFTATMDTIDEAYFETLGIPILRGRAFRRSDSANAPRVAIVNEQFANRYWPGADAVGQRIHIDGSAGELVEIVGVVKTIKYRQPSERPTDFVYLPFAQHPVPRMLLLMRTSGDPLQWVKPVAEVVRALDANLPVSEVRTYEDLYRYHAIEGPGVAIDLVATIGAVGVLLASAGLYGLMAYNVSRRTREIGVRIAIGASKTSILRLVMGKGLVLVAVGTAIGLALGLGIERFMNAMVFNAGSVDVVSYLVVVPSMFLVTMLATYVPARRASKIAPTEALRCE